MTQVKQLKLERHSDGVARVIFDVPGESVNTLRAEFAQEFESVFDEIDSDLSIAAVVICSGKKDSFIAGADIGMLQAARTADEATRLSQTGQMAMSRVSECRVPVVAAIHGACLGGGLELALACHGRVASQHSKTKLGLPEVQLGILPGMGGTQRLVSVVGLSNALDMLLTGRQFDSRRAARVGLVDEVVAPQLIVDTAAARALALASDKQKSGGAWGSLRGALDPEVLKDLALAENPIGRKVVFDQARKRLLSKTHGNYPAPERILEVVKLGLERGLEAGLEAEAQAFGELVVSAQAIALRHVYFSQQALKKDEGSEADVNAESHSALGVIGAGLMGAGVSFVSLLNAGAAVRLKDVSPEGLQKGLRSVAKELDERVARRRISRWERNAILARLTRATDFSGMKNLDVVIEAVFEDLELKRQVLKEFEQEAGAKTIFASNTSSLPILRLAEVAEDPSRVIGMHYFSPVAKMPLLEVITTEQTAPWVTKTCVSLGKAQGKTVIVVNDGPGFYTTRILAPYLNEAAFCLMEGQRIEEVDRQLEDAGFPLGPLALLDEVGIDVGTKVAKILTQEIGARLAPPTELGDLTEKGRLGKKNGRGFYDYQNASNTGRQVDESVYADLGLHLPKGKSEFPTGIAEPGSAAERCLLVMVNEAAHCMGEGILRSPRDGDIGAIFGLGFPPFLGGPFHFIEQRGAAEVIARLERLEREFGARFTPAPYLRSLLD